ncbi:EAL domain-containing protein [Duganella sp. CF458]|uniref:sensor domain-containing protein n=1 Tax=Duganella sp. CF458 TaxID=1884368 RepID=UPI00147D3AD7|nr:EAL domain-containing protein [Duganella sp. CF458]
MRPPSPTDLTPVHAALDLIARMVGALELTPMVAISSLDRDGKVTFCNSQFERLAGLSMQQAIGRPLVELLSRAERQEEHDAMVEEVWRSGKPGPLGDWHVRSFSGRDLWLYSTKVPVWQDGAMAQIVCMDVDVTQRKDDESALRAVGENFSLMFGRSSDAVLIMRDGTIAEANPAAMRLFKCDAVTRLAGHRLHEFSPLRQPAGELSETAVVKREEGAFSEGNNRFEWCFADCEGKTFWAEVLMTALQPGHSDLLYVVVRDISDRRRTEHAVRLSAQVFENSRDAIVLTDRSRHIIASNRAYAQTTGFTAEELLGQSISLYRSGVQDESFYREVWSQVDARDHWQGETWSRRKNGEIFPCWVSVTAIRDQAGLVSNYMGSLSDITERKKSEEYTRHLAEHDFLTDLPNRVLLLDRLNLALAAARRSKTALAVLFLDLDRFKMINDTLGHAVGDRLLKEVAARLLKCVRSVDTVSRHGGDEFVVVLAEVGGPERAAHVADTVLKAITQEYVLGEHLLHISTSIGIAMFPSDGADIDSLVKHADIAMYHAKQAGRDRYQFFGQEMNARVVEHASLEKGLRRALDEGQFELAYQPEVDIASGEVVGMEALLRWRRPEQGLLLPQQFLEVAQEAGLMLAIGGWVLRSACSRARGWQDEGRQLAVSVNIAISQFMHKNFIDSVADALRGSGLAPQWLELELTEDTIMRSGPGVLEKLGALRELGVRVSIDDFGTGYSQLLQLKAFPIHKLKIAQSFLDNGTDATAIRTIIAMARSLDMTVIAEGVETEDQLQLLRELGCDQYQGQLAESAVRSAP